MLASPGAGAEEPDRPAAAERLRQVEQSAAAAERLRQVEQSAAAAALAQQQLRDASSQRTESLRALNQRAMVLAGSVQDDEAALSALEAALADLETRQATDVAALALSRKQQGRLFAALERLAIRLPETLGFAVADPLDAIRAADLSAATLRALQERAGQIRDEISRAAALAHDATQKRDAVARAVGLLSAEQARLAAVVTEQQALQRQDSLDLQTLSGRLALLGREAADLRDLIQRLDGDAEAAKVARENAGPENAEIKPPADPGPAPAELRPFSQALGHLRYPAAGRIARRWGDLDAFGTAAKGLTLQTRWAAEVVAPFDGQIVFADEFKDTGAS